MPHVVNRSMQSGIALVLALWITVLLTVLASGFAFSLRSEALATRNAVSLARVRALADGALE
ncbi:MAG TPA: type II secretion system protein GspK, partial [Casimicrobiaceae bacterium]|nr:type II secretion system protein GspK [Casimicrobiaceae bacterium]